MGKITKQWKTDGEEDKFIQKLIKKGSINKYTTPKSLLTGYPAVFGNFSENVIRNHLNLAKRSSGVLCESNFVEVFLFIIKCNHTVVNEDDGGSNDEADEVQKKESEEANACPVHLHLAHPKMTSS